MIRHAPTFSQSGTRLGFLVLLLAVALCDKPASTTHAASAAVGCSAGELITAIRAANANPGADVLDLTAGCLYRLTTVDNSDPNLGPNGVPVITSPITINGHGATIAREDAAPAFRLFQIDSGAVINLNELTLSGAAAGDGTTTHLDGFDGGAIHNRGTLNAANTTFSHNRAGTGDSTDLFHAGGGKGGHGGALYNDGAAILSNVMVIENSAGRGGFTDPLGYGGAAGGHGGAIYNAGTLTLDSGTLNDNLTAPGVGNRFGGTVGGGGAIYNAGTLTLQASIFSHNRTGDGTGYMGGSPGGDGGAVYNTGTAQVTDTTFEDNLTGNGGGTALPVDPGGGGRGGALFNNVGGTLNLMQSLLTANKTGSGNPNTIRAGHGGMGGAAANLGTAALINCTLSANLTGNGGSGGVNGRGGDGGALANERGELTLLNLTIHANGTGSTPLPGRGGGLASSRGTLTLTNSILANNSPGKNCKGVITYGLGNLRFPSTDRSCVGIYGNPRLGTLRDNGGPTRTMALRAGSRATNAAVDASCPAADQRGVARPQGKHCDIGAFELDKPGKPQLLSPAPDEHVSGLQVWLEWKAVAWADKYRVVTKLDGKKGALVDQATVTGTRHKIIVPRAARWYYWRVTACNGAGCAHSEWQRFRDV